MWGRWEWKTTEVGVEVLEMGSTRYCKRGRGSRCELGERVRGV